VNQKFAEIIGFTREELLGTPGRIRWADPEERDRMVSLLNDQGGFLSNYETRVLAKNGSVKNVLASIKLHPVDGFLEGIMVDITERKGAEKALKESEIKFQNTVKYLDEGYYSCALDGLLLEHNQAFNQILGFDVTLNLKGEKLPDFWQNPEDRNIYLSELMAKGFIRNFLINAQTISGRKIVVMANSHLVKNEKDQPIRIDGVFTDFTEPKRVQEELERSNKELEQFAYVASHDLQEPLRMISSFTQLLARRYKDKLDAEANEFIDYAVDGANRMQRLINDLLIYSRVGSKGKPFAATDLNTIMGQVLVILNPVIEENHAIITNNELPTASVDESQMVQLFQNLIGNAIKFRSMEPPLIHVSVNENDREWTFGIKDNGIGIDLQYKERIFGVFQRLHSKEEYPGTGIGLAICKKIVERHGGRIWIESTPGKGSAFYFTLPKHHGQ
jgi:PAS domain S-box-containing protein